MNEATCQCRAIRISLPALQPATPTLFHCHCTQCQAQSSSAFGTTAIYPDMNLPVDTQPLSVWTRETNDPGFAKDCYFCSVCGVRLVHRTRKADEPREEAGAKVKYQVVEGRSISIKGGCIKGLDWSNGVHIYCNTAVTNLEFPDEVERFVEEETGPRWEPKRVQR